MNKQYRVQVRAHRQIEFDIVWPIELIEIILSIRLQYKILSNVTDVFDRLWAHKHNCSDQISNNCLTKDKMFSGEGLEQIQTSRRDSCVDKTTMDDRNNLQNSLTNHSIFPIVYTFNYSA